MRKLPLTMALGIAITTGISARAEGAAPATPTTQPDTVSRAEYEQLKRDQDELRREIAELKKERLQRQQQEAAAPSVVTPPNGRPIAGPSQGGGAAPGTGAAAATSTRDEDLDEIDRTIRDIKFQMREYRLGTEKLLIAGDASIGFTAQHGSSSTFEAGIAPLALWQPYEKILIEAAADIGISSDEQGHSDTSFDLTIANASYLVNNNLTLGGGLFVAPFGVYHRHFDPPWINKLPDDPLVFSDGGLAPSSILGAFATGAVPVHKMKILYDAYVSNGPNLETQDPGSAGSLHFDNYTDINNNKAVGGRIGFQPIPELEAGYSIQYGTANSAGFKDVHVVLQAVDAAYRRDFKQIYGTLDVHGGWVWSDVGKATYDPHGTLGFGPTRFGNARNGGYVLVAYRPSLVSNPILRKFEFITRYDAMFVPVNAPGGDHEQRWTLGVDYWLTPAAVLKAAYEFDHRKVGDNSDAFLLQLGLGL